MGTLKSLIEFGAYDMSEVIGANISEKGSYIWNLNHIDWFNDPNYDLYFIRVDGKIAGFVIIRQIPEEDIYYLNHFLILRKFRGKIIGKSAAIQAFNLYEGNWRVSEFDWNIPAQIFWRKVLKDYTNDQ